VCVKVCFWRFRDELSENAVLNTVFATVWGTQNCTRLGSLYASPFIAFAPPPSTRKITPPKLNKNDRTPQPAELRGVTPERECGRFTSRQAKLRTLPRTWYNASQKTLDQLAQSGDLDVRRQATWGMSVLTQLGEHSLATHYFCQAAPTRTHQARHTDRTKQ